jgi:hypothetical protein
MKARKILAWSLLVIGLIGWPVSQLTFARNEPPMVLALSWLAIILSALDAVFIVKVEEEND